MKYQFGDKIRIVRERKNITLKEVAQEARVSESLVSQIERNKVSPAIDTLLRIADVLEIDLEYLFQDFKKNKLVHLVKKENRNKLVRQGVRYEQLSKTADLNEEHGIEAYYMEIAKGKTSGSKEYGHPGKELGIIIQGKGEFRIGNQTHYLKEGDSLSFISDVPHQMKNIGDVPLKAYWIITPPKAFFKEI